MARIAVLVPDLMLSSRMVEPLRAAGYEVVTGSLPEVAEDADLLVCDLDSVDPVEVASLGLPSIGFHSHLDRETGEKGRSAGLGLVVPRSRAARELPELVATLLES